MTAALIYLAILLMFIGGGVVAMYRGQLSKGVKDILIWGTIFVAVTAGFTFFQSQTTRPSASRAMIGDAGEIVLRRDIDGHFSTIATVNGVDIEFLVDTGATRIVLNEADAGRVGIPTDRLAFAGQARTANGIVRTAAVRLDTLSLGGLTARNVPATVNGGALDVSLLGMDFLNGFSRITIEGDELVLER